MTMPGTWETEKIAAHNRRWGTLLAVVLMWAPAQKAAAAKRFTETFGADKAELASVGANRFFVLVPGYYEVLKGAEGGRPTVLTITVLNETKLVDGVQTRVVEEKEVSKGQTIEVSRNYYAISRRTTDVFYFGEDTDAYKAGKVAGHEGSWLAGVGGARFGLMMPGTPLLGARYQQEMAPKTAMDRAEVISLSATRNTPAGFFKRCLKTEESSEIESGKEYKFYAPGVGLLQDGGLRLVKYGFKKR